MLLGACVLATGAMAALLAQRDATAALRLQSGAHLTEVARSLAAALDRELFQRWRDIQAIAALDPLRDPPAPAAARRAWLGRLPETFPAFAESASSPRRAASSPAAAGCRKASTCRSRTTSLPGASGPMRARRMRWRRSPRWPTPGRTCRRGSSPSPRRCARLSPRRCARLSPRRCARLSPRRCARRMRPGPASSSPGCPSTGWQS
ncbi:hypothetical protein ACFQY5_18450 [Paeniroseomonas aquatica]|uniref:hypothetical protein n=1 Tax=Paeniroseomonas aquatica TaxID=373043 RepID=UPI0036127C93